MLHELFQNFGHLKIELQEADPQSFVGGWSRAHSLEYLGVFVLKGSVESEMCDFGVLAAAGGLAVAEVLHPEPAFEAEDPFLPEADVLKVLIVSLVAAIVLFETHQQL